MSQPTLRRTVLVVGSGLIAGCSGHDEAPVAVSGTVWFEDEAALKGLDIEHRSGFDGRYLFPEIMGGGAALADVDGDGDLDAYLVQSGRVEGRGEESNANRLFLNDGTGFFAAAKRRQRRVQTAGSYLAANDPRVQFGLGSAKKIAQVEVHWPRGTRERSGDFEAGVIAELRLGAAQAIDARQADNAK